MSLILDHESEPAGLTVETRGFLPQVVYLGKYTISFEDFLRMAHYVLTNTPLIRDNDPRLQFVRCVGSMKKVSSLRPGERFLGTDVPPIP
mgnify:CR=1 FL=1